MKNLTLFAVMLAFALVGAHFVDAACFSGGSWSSTPASVTALCSGKFSATVNFNYYNPGCFVVTQFTPSENGDGNIEVVPTVTPTATITSGIGNLNVTLSNGELQENDEPGSIQLDALATVCNPYRTFVRHLAVTVPDCE